VRVQFLLFVAVALAAAQIPPATGAVCGTVIESYTGAPITGATIRLAGKTVAVTNGLGEYCADSVAVGLYSAGVSVPRDQGDLSGSVGDGGCVATDRYVPRYVVIADGRHGPARLDFGLDRRASISGTVLDQDQRPATGVRVALVSREFRSGEIRYSQIAWSPVDTRGNYSFRCIYDFGRPFFLAAVSTPTIAGWVRPPTPKVRPVYFPGSAAREDAVPITLHSGENRTGADMQVTTGPSFCVDGRVTPDGTVRVPTYVTAELADSVDFGNLANIRQANGGWQYQICGLHAGDYSLKAYASYEDFSPVGLAVAVTVADQNVHDVTLSLGSAKRLEVRVEWDGPEDASKLGRVQIEFDPNLHAESSVPDTFVTPPLTNIDYAVHIWVDGAYAKSVTYRGEDLTRRPLRISLEAGIPEPLVVKLAPGGNADFHLRDDDGYPVCDARVYVMPADADSTAELSASLKVETPENCKYRPLTLAPGKYLVLATKATVYPQTPESLEMLWQTRTKAQKVEISAGQQTQIELAPLPLAHRPDEGR